MSSAQVPTIEIEMIGDTVCAWTWVGKRHLEEAMEMRKDGANYEQRWRSVFLDEKFMGEETKPHLDWLAKEYGEDVAKLMAEKKLELFTMGHAKGIDFDTSRHMADSTRSHCLLHYAASVSLEKQQALVELLLKIHFLDAKNLNDVTVLLDAAKEVGLDPDASKKAMEDPALKEQVWAEHRHARKDLGVEGLPFFVLRLKGVEDVTKPRSFKHDEPTSSIVACIDELIAEHQKRQQ